MKEIGGYFDFELPMHGEYHKNTIRLNTARNSFEYILRAKKYKKVYLPYYTCEVMLEPIKKLNISLEFYSVDDNFYPIFEYQKIQREEVFVYNNYFGIYDQKVKEISQKVQNLIIDNSQAFFSKPLPGVDTFYSARKFFGLSDGAYLYTDTLMNKVLEKDISYQRIEHLVGRIDLNAASFYETFKRNDDSLIDQPIKEMSNLTRRIIQSIDYKFVAERRKENFFYYQENLKASNELEIAPDKESVPMFYPYLIQNGMEIKKKLIKNKIYVPTYWPNVLEWTNNPRETYLVNNLLCLPIDQRYNIETIKNIVNTLWNLK